MKKKIFFTLFLLVIIMSFAAFSGTKFSVLGIYTINFDDPDNYVDVFPITYFDIGLTENVMLRFNDYISLDSSVLSYDFNNETYKFKLPRYYYLQYKMGYDLLLMFGKFKFRDYPYDIRSDFSFRIGGFRDDLGDSNYTLNPMNMAIGGYIKPFGEFKFGGAFDLENKSIYAYAGLDDRYTKYMFYLSQDNEHNKLSASFAGYNSIKFNRKLITQLYYGVGYSVSSSVETISEISNNLSDLIEILPVPKINIGGKINYYPVYLKGIIYYNMDENNKNLYYLDVDAATNNPTNKKWLYEARVGYYLPKPWTLELFFQGNSLDEGILTDYVTNYGIKLIGEDFDLIFAMEDINGRADGKQKFVIGFTTWTDFVFTERPLNNILF
ncbi:hypothetical protein [Marinitoga sp. 38H-ov]|uniref:hypothetical protein n=1 Tax=Marinitoga sp. 38H-ov TaxID=1755814 RepID=UPI0013EA49F8|nr:hypothetical protein [Marinitoga sp. 38H-ov]KAF2955520.1 hypothetical protein AS160_10000 [Marinitoga sp. 38H-ov]